VKIIVLENLKELAINLEIHSFNGLKKEITSSGICRTYYRFDLSELTIEGIFRNAD
jgi:hypothetical protein